LGFNASMPKETVLITGASAGIGWEIARLFAKDQSNLVLVARREDRLNELAEKLRNEHQIEVTVIASDLSKPESPRQIHDRLKDEKVEVDIVVNNAGFGAIGKTVELDLYTQLDMIRLNIEALVHLTRLFLPGIIARNRGGILNVASTAAFQPGPFMSVYYASKAFVLSFTDALHEELKGTNVKVSCLCPGPTETEFADVADVNQINLFSSGVMHVDDVVRIGYEGFRKNKPIVITGFRNKLLAQSIRFTPRFLVRKVVRFLNTKK